MGSMLLAQSQISEQYRNSHNLDARIALHDRFSTNKYDWMRWVFDHMLAAPAVSRVLEIGCGTGQLWKNNLDRIPSHWAITLSDASAGMIETARTNLAATSFAAASFAAQVQFRQFDADHVPFDTASFDIVIANHMLYHVPNIDNTLGELRRVLKPGGQLFAATNGPNHMRELDELLVGFDPALKLQAVTDQFQLDNGAPQLQKYFAQVSLQRYDSNLVVTEPAPLLAYVYSMIRAFIIAERWAAFEAYVHAKFAERGGTLFIQKETGLFVAKTSEKDFSE